MTNTTFIKKLSAVVLLLALVAPCAHAKKTRLVSVSADVVEIGGSMSSVKGFAWNQIFDFEEAAIPGIFSLGDFERKTAVATRLRLMETEGRAQILSNPKIVTSSGNPTACSRLPATRLAKVAPAQVSSGSPAHRASAALAWAL